ncbi:TIGR01777 family oxidoreductase [Pedobacter sp.]|uniref:TIGR01777 family oxidoreductase n=1 Tax=Pedobacter sp. TaxID=1411316 RepID=UPI00396CE7A3
MDKRILITGATGLIGKELVQLLLLHGYKVSILSRHAISTTGVDVYLWDIANNQIDLKAFDNVDVLVHLAGESIAAKRWTKRQKKEIINSRVNSANLLFETVKKHQIPLKKFICSSAVGIYGDRGTEVLTENSRLGNGFLPLCCKLWENAADQFNTLGIDVVKIRTGFVLSDQGGALGPITKMIRWYLGAPLGSGKQLVPWIHLNDLTAIYLKAISNNKMKGTYNACAANPVTNKTLTVEIAKILKKPILPLHVPSFMLRLLMGKMSILPLMSTLTSNRKLEQTGFSFKFDTLQSALKDIFHKN